MLGEHPDVRQAAVEAVAGAGGKRLVAFLAPDVGPGRRRAARVHEGPADQRHAADARGAPARADVQPGVRQARPADAARARRAGPGRAGATRRRSSPARRSSRRWPGCGSGCSARPRRAGRTSSPAAATRSPRCGWSPGCGPSSAGRSSSTDLFAAPTVAGARRAARGRRAAARQGADHRQPADAGPAAAPALVHRPARARRRAVQRRAGQPAARRSSTCPRCGPRCARCPTGTTCCAGGSGRPRACPYAECAPPADVPLDGRRPVRDRGPGGRAAPAARGGRPARVRPGHRPGLAGDAVPAGARRARAGDHRAPRGVRRLVAGGAVRRPRRGLRAGPRRRPPALAPLAASYADYAVWRAERDQRGGAADLAWWTEHLAGAPTVVDLPRDRPRPAVATYAGAEASVPLPSDVDTAVRDAGRRARHDAGRRAARRVRRAAGAAHRRDRPRARRDRRRPRARRVRRRGRVLRRHRAGAAAHRRGGLRRHGAGGCRGAARRHRAPGRAAGADRRRARRRPRHRPARRWCRCCSTSSTSPSRACALPGPGHRADRRCPSPARRSTSPSTSPSGTAPFAFDTVYNPDLFDAERGSSALLTDLAELVGALAADAGRRRPRVVAPHLPPAGRAGGGRRRDDRRRAGDAGVPPGRAVTRSPRPSG